MKSQENLRKAFKEGAGPIRLPGMDKKNCSLWKWQRLKAMKFICLIGY